MNAFIVLSALVSAAVAVPHNSRLIDNYGDHGQVYGGAQILTKSYEEPRYISAPVYSKSYDEPRYISAPRYSKSYDERRIISAPVYSKSYDEPRIIHGPVLTRSYAEPEVSYGGHQVLTKAYAAPVAEQVYGKSYTRGVSTHYSIKHDVPSKSYGHSKSYAVPVLTKSYAQPIHTRSYAEPILTRSYDAPILRKSYAEPIQIHKSIVNDYNMESDYGYGKNY